MRRFYLPVAASLAIVIAGLLTGPGPTRQQGLAMLPATLYLAQTALRQLRFRGYDPAFHRQLWNTLESSRSDATDIV